MSAKTAVKLGSLQSAGGDMQVAAKEQRSLMEILRDPRTKNGIAQVVGNIMSPDRMMQLCIAATKGNPDLLKCSPPSVLGALMTAAALGLEPNTIQQQAFLIPYAKRGMQPDGTWGVISYECQFQIGYRGYITMAHRSPAIASLEADCIHENDLFEHVVGTNALFKFQKKLRNRGEPIGAFCYVRFTSGAEAALVLPFEEIEKIRECSDTYTSLRDRASSDVRTFYKKGQRQEVAKTQKERDRDVALFSDTPWVKWFDDMAIKSVIKKMAKQLPLEQGRTLAAAANLESGDGRIIDMEKMTDPDFVLSVVNNGFPPPEVDTGNGEFVESGAVVEEEHEDGTVTITGYAESHDEQRGAEPAPESEAVQVAPESEPETVKGNSAIHEAEKPTMIDLIARAGQCNDTDDLMAVVADAEHLPPTERKRVQRAANARRAELENGGGQMSLG